MALTYEQFAEYRAKGALLEKEANVNDVVPSRTYVSQQSKDVVYDLTVGLDAQYPEYAQRYQTENPPIIQNLSDADVAKLLGDDPPAPDAPQESDLSPLEIYRLKRAAARAEELEEENAPPSESQDDASSWKQTQNNVLTAIGAPTSSDTEEQDIKPSNDNLRWAALYGSLTGSNSVQEEEGPTPNPLHAYASYTYGITLHMLSRDDFNKMASDPKSDWSPTTTLIASGGNYLKAGFSRDPAFGDDFFIDNLKFMSIIGSTQANQGTNVADVTFTITEPYGMTLIDRLIDACVSKNAEGGGGLVDGSNYTEIPYLLQVDFFGYNDDGTVAELKSQRKYIPINLRNITIKVGIQGATYEVQAGIYPHRAFTQNVAAIPANFEVTASTLEEFFAPDANVMDQNKTYNERYEQFLKEKSNLDKTKNSDTRSAGGADSKSAAETTYEVRSLVAAYNAWNARTKQNNSAQDFNTIRVVFDDEILASGGGKITAPKADSVKQVATADPNNPNHKQQVAKANAGQQTAKPNLNINKFTFKTGTSVMQIINMMMQNSEYIRRQVIDPTIDAEQNVSKYKKDVDWWKITPSVKMRSFCTQNSTWFLDVTYYVKKKTVYNRTHPNLSQSLPPSVCKEYNYIFTGQNNDIIDFSIQFDALFYTAVSIDRNKGQAVVTNAGVSYADQQNEQDPDVVESNASKAKSGGVQSKTRKPVAGQLGTQSTASATKDSVGTGASSAADAINAGTGSDQLQVDLKIVGDPQFIKQDEVYMNPEARKLDPVASSGAYIASNDGSLDMDSKEIHALLTWKTPVDIDENTGGMRIDGKYHESVYSGIFDIRSVDSVFSQGKFEQTLSLVRLQGQPRDYKDSNSKRSLSEREAGKTSPSVNTETNVNRYESVTGTPTEPAQSAMNVASRNWTPTQTASDENSNNISPNQDTEVDANSSTGYVDQTNRSVLSAITRNTTTPPETLTADTFPPTQTPAEIISTSPVVQSSTSSPASSVTPDETPTPVGYGNTENITDAQVQSNPVYTQTYNNNVALGVPPLLAAQQASQAARQAIALGN